MWFFDTPGTPGVASIVERNFLGSKQPVWLRIPDAILAVLALYCRFGLSTVFFTELSEYILFNIQKRLGLFFGGHEVLKLYFKWSKNSISWNISAPKYQFFNEELKFLVQNFLTKFLKQSIFEASEAQSINGVSKLKLLLDIPNLYSLSNVPWLW